LAPQTGLPPEHLLVQHALPEQGPSQAFVVELQKNINIIPLVYIIRVITELPTSKQSYKGKVKTHNYTNRQNQSTTGKL
jgi:hypothetical protein